MDLLRVADIPVRDDPSPASNSICGFKKIAKHGGVNGDLAEGNDVSFTLQRDRSSLPHLTFPILISLLVNSKDAIASSKFVIHCTGAMKRTHGCDVERG